MRRLSVLLLLGAMVGGCVRTARSPGQRLLDAGNYGEAVRAFEYAEQRSPESSTVKTKLGLALLGAGHAGRAVTKLVEARDLDPDSRGIRLFLGQAYERSGEVDSALQSYDAYLRLGGKPSEIRARMAELARKKAERQVHRALALEDSLSSVPPPANTLVVPNFANTADREDFEPLSRGLATVMATDLVKVKELRVLERQYLSTLLAELELAGAPSAVDSSALIEDPTTVTGVQQRLKRLLQPNSREPYFRGEVDGKETDAYLEAVRSFQADHGLVPDGVIRPETSAALEQAMSASGAMTSRVRRTPVVVKDAPRVGMLLRARHLVQGYILPAGESRLQLDAAVIDASSGETVPTGEPVDGKLQDVLQLEKALVYQTLKRLGIEPTPQEREQIDLLATESFPAFQAYCRGLMLEDQGRLAAAKSAFEEATAADPGFTQAAEEVEVLEGNDETFQAAVEGEQQAVFNQEEPTAPDRLLTDVVRNVGTGPAPDDGAGNSEGSDLAAEPSGEGGDMTPVNTEKVPVIPAFPPPPGGAR